MKGKICSLISVLFLTGCSDFLEERSQDEVRPSMVNDLEQILLGDGYQESNFYYATEIFTDNVESVGAQSAAEKSQHDKEKWLYMWCDNMFDEDGGGYDVRFWEAPYSSILGCNLVLDYLDDMKGDDDMRESIRGEALTLRAWYYLHLVNFFGIAYNQGNPEVDLGVPLKLDATVTGDFFARNTVKEVYEQIEKDLLEGNRLLSTYEYKRNFFRIDHLAAKAILSRMYLYMENWDKALAYADSVLMVKPDLFDMNSISLSRPNSSTASVYSTETPDEIIWGREYDRGFEVPGASLPPFSISSDLGGLYVKGEWANLVGRTVEDLRALYFYWKIDIMGNRAWKRIGITKGKGDLGGFQGIRTAELYLNRAEAYAQKFIIEGNDTYREAALADLNMLRKNRFNKEFYKEIDVVDKEELLDYCLTERRRELCGETNHRWCDLRRYGKTVKHVLVESELQEFEQNMSLFALPIPEDVLKQNPNLKQN